MEKNKFKKILILRYEHIGDYGLTIPIIASIKKKFPKSEIDIAIGPWNKELAKATPDINNIIIFDNPLVKRNLTYLEILKIILFRSNEIRKHIQKLNNKNYDLLIDFSDRKFSLLLDGIIKAKKKILGTNFPYVGEREVDRMGRIISKCLEIKKPLKKGKLKYSSQDKKIVMNLLKKVGFKNKKMILIHPITPLKEKDWALKKWIKLIKKINGKNKKVLFLLLGSKKQGKEILDLIEQINLKNVESIAGKLNIPQFILLISKCDLIIGGDSGPVHLAELTKTPIATLYGPTDEKRWGPPKNQGIFIKKNNIKNIKVRDVLKIIKKLSNLN